MESSSSQLQVGQTFGDDSLEDTDNLPAPEVIAQEIIEDLEAALTAFTAVAQALVKDDEA